MYAATIVPEKFLPLTEGDEFYMALAHLIDGDNPYTAFYKKMSDLGSYVLMDNGAAENAQLNTIEDILKRADMIGASEVVLPDHLMDKDETLRKTQGALKWLKANNRQHDFDWMAVPQGRDLGAWRYCLINLLDMDMEDKLINSIGISKFLSLNLEPMARLAAVEMALELFEVYDRNIAIHLLGCAYDPAEIAHINQKYPGKIRSCDSAIAYVYAQRGLVLSSDTNRPQYEIEFLADHDIDMALFINNIQLWKELEVDGQLLWKM